MLTTRQNQLLDFIAKTLAESNRSPSFEEMCEALALKSKNGLSRHLDGLIERGFIRKRPSQARSLELVTRSQQDTDFIPHYGRVAAGLPIAALPQNEQFKLHPDWLGKVDYALTVDGSSMIDAGIMDGDTALIRAAVTAPPRSIVVALVNDEETTLKYYYPNGKKVILKPANAEHVDQHYHASQVQIQGVLAYIFRDLEAKWKV